LKAIEEAAGADAVLRRVYSGAHTWFSGSFGVKRVHWWRRGLTNSSRRQLDAWTRGTCVDRGADVQENRRKRKLMLAKRMTSQPNLLLIDGSFVVFVVRFGWWNRASSRRNERLYPVFISYVII